MTLLIILLVLFLYLGIGAVVTYTLYHLYISANPRFGNDRFCDDKGTYCVMVGATWPFTAWFAFAVFFAKYGLPESKEKERKQ